LAWSPDNKWIVFGIIDPKTAQDIWILPLSGDRKPVPFLNSLVPEYHAQVSPDGKWLAYTSTGSGQPEIHVKSFPSGEGTGRLRQKAAFFRARGTMAKNSSFRPLPEENLRQSGFGQTELHSKPGIRKSSLSPISRRLLRQDMQAISMSTPSRPTVSDSSSPVRYLRPREETSRLPSQSS
jgi:hypothetical protein